MAKDGDHPVRSDGAPPQDGASGASQRLALYEHHTQISYSCLLPPAQELERLQRLLPDAVERLFAEVEREAACRREDNRRALHSEIRRSEWGLALAFVCFSFCIGAAVYLGMHGHDWLAGVLAGTPIAGALTAFIHGTNVRKAERIEKAKILADIDDDPADET